MRYWLVIIVVSIFLLPGCQSKALQFDDKSGTSAHIEKKLISNELEQKYLGNLKNTAGNIQIVHTIKMYFDKDNEQELVVLYNDMVNNSKSNLAIINSYGISAIDLASDDHDYVFTDPNNVKVIQKESNSNEIIIPLYNQRLNHILNIRVTMEMERDNTKTFKIHSELSE